MKEKKLQNLIEIEQKTLLVIVDTLSFMSKNYHVSGVIDHAAWIISKQDVDDTIEKLMPYLNSDDSVAFVKMNLKDWNIYTRMIDYAGYSAPEQKNRAMLEKLHNFYSDMEDRNDLKKTYSELSSEEKIKLSIKDHKNLFDKLADL